MFPSFLPPPRAQWPPRRPAAAASRLPDPAPSSEAPTPVATSPLPDPALSTSDAACRPPRFGHRPMSSPLPTGPFSPTSPKSRAPRLLPSPPFPHRPIFSPGPSHTRKCRLLSSSPRGQIHAHPLSDVAEAAAAMTRLPPKTRHGKWRPGGAARVGVLLARIVGGSSGRCWTRALCEGSAGGRSLGFRLPESSSLVEVRDEPRAPAALELPPDLATAAADPERRRAGASPTLRYPTLRSTPPPPLISCSLGCSPSTPPSTLLYAGTRVCPRASHARG